MNDNNTYIDSLVNTLKAILKSRDFDIKDEDDVVLKYEVNRAIKEINRCRRFTQTNEKIIDPKYEDMIIPLAITSFAKIGAEGQTSHSENGVVRNYTSGGDYPKDMLDEIIPLIK